MEAQDDGDDLRVLGHRVGVASDNWLASAQLGLSRPLNSTNLQGLWGVSGERGATSKPLGKAEATGEARPTRTTV